MTRLQRLYSGFQAFSRAEVRCERFECGAVSGLESSSSSRTDLMMINEIVVLGMALVYTGLLIWSCRVLPRRALAGSGDRCRWCGSEQGRWRGLNITFYGLFQACAFTVAVTLMLVMLGSVQMETLEILSLPAFLLVVCVPASKWMARLIEKKPQTLTVGGASFVGLLLCPWFILAWDVLLGLKESHLMPVLASVAVSYAFGEGLGRLACISFGCCYGKPLDACSPTIRRLVRNRAFVFTGDTKKIAYAGGLAGRPVLPVQAMNFRGLRGCWTHRLLSVLERPAHVRLSIGNAGYPGMESFFGNAAGRFQGCVQGDRLSMDGLGRHCIQRAGGALGSRTQTSRTRRCIGPVSPVESGASSGPARIVAHHPRVLRSKQSHFVLNRVSRGPK